MKVIVATSKRVDYGRPKHIAFYATRQDTVEMAMACLPGINKLLPEIRNLDYSPTMQKQQALEDYYALMSIASRQSVESGKHLYAGAGQLRDKPGPDDAWWLGFDCAHYNDRQDPSLPAEHRMPHYSPGAVIRTQEYVESECRKLCEQAAAVATNNTKP